jgi:hypothetical protein
MVDDFLQVPISIAVRVLFFITGYDAFQKWLDFIAFQQRTADVH